MIISLTVQCPVCEADYEEMCYGGIIHRARVSEALNVRDAIREDAKKRHAREERRDVEALMQGLGPPE